MSNLTSHHSHPPHRAFTHPIHILFLATLALFLIYSLFINLLPTVYGEYTDRRFLLCGGMLWLLLLQVLVTPDPNRVLFIATLWSVWLISIVAASAKPDSTAPVSLWLEPVYYSLYIFAVLAIADLVRCTSTEPHKTMAIISYMAAIVCFAYGTMTVNVYLFAAFDGFSQLQKIIPWGFVNVRYWGHMASWLLWLLPLACLSGPWKQHRLWRGIVFLAAALWWWILFLSLSRGSLLSLFLSAMIVMLLFGKHARPWARIATAQVLLGAVFWLVLSVIVPSIIFEELSVRTLTASSSGRVLLWQEALAMSVQHFPFGMGPMSWMTHSPILAEYPGRVYLSHPHSMYLMAAAEYGWAALLPLTLTVYLGWRRIARIKNSPENHDERPPIAAVAFIAASLAGAIHAQFSGVFTAPSSMLVGLIVLGTTWGGITPAPQHKKHGQPYLRAGLLLAIALGGYIWWYSVIHYHQAMKADEPFYLENVKNPRAPRFWFHGNFPREPERMPKTQNGATHRPLPAVD